jgi:hypothetical protein
VKNALLMTPRRAWNLWWFSPISPVPLGLFRIMFGLLVLAYGLLLFPDRVMWFGEQGTMTSADSDRYNFQYSLSPRIDLLYGMTNEHWLTIFFLVFFVFALGLALGLATRLCTVAVFIQLVSLHNRDALIHNSGDTLMMVMAAYLLLAPSGAALSLDRLIRIRRGREGRTPPLIVPWAQRLMQLQIATVYCSTSLSKLSGGMWQKGTAVYYAMKLPDMERFPVPWVDSHHVWFVHLLTWGAITVELSLWTLIWLPRTRLYALAAGTLLHLGIEYAMNIPLFSFTMIACYVLFLTEADFRNFARWASRKGFPVRPIAFAVTGRAARTAPSRVGRG